MNRTQAGSSSGIKRGDTLQVVEPLRLLGRGLGHEARRPELAERGVLPFPPLSHEGDDGLCPFARHRVVAPGHAAHVPAVEQEVRDALRMPHRIGHAHGATLGDAEQGKAVETGRVHDGLEVGHEGLERDVGRVPIGQPVPPLVVAD